MSCTPESKHCPRIQPPPPCCIQHIIDVVGLVGKILDETGIVWWADYGTLLGAVRDGGIIPWDNDADLGVFAKDQARILDLKTEFESKGLAFCYHPPGPRRFSSGDWVNITRSHLNGNGLDIFFWHNYDEVLSRIRYGAMDHKKGRSFPSRWIGSRKKVSWEGTYLWLPEYEKELTAHRYSDWETPRQYGKEGP